MITITVTEPADDAPTPHVLARVDITDHGPADTAHHHLYQVGVDRALDRVGETAFLHHRPADGWLPLVSAALQALDETAADPPGALLDKLADAIQERDTAQALIGTVKAERDAALGDVTYLEGTLEGIRARLDADEDQGRPTDTDALRLEIDETMTHLVRARRERRAHADDTTSPE